MAGKLRPVPDSPPRAVLYLRQSISHDDSVSLELQEAAGRDYCTREGYQVVAVLADPGISGRTWKRPSVVRTMEMIETGEADVIVLWKWSRLSRSRRDWALAADRADVAGGRIESSTESVDIGTATGRLTRGMLVELAAFESDRIGEVWREVHKSRLARGLVPNGNPRYGYVWDRDADMHVPHPVDGPALREAYERYVAGEGFFSICRWMNQRGLKTTKGGQWVDRHLMQVLDRGFGAGQIVWGTATVPGAHEVVVPPELWQAYLDRRAANRQVAPRTKTSSYLLSGMVKCALCGGSMVGNATKAQGPRFRCTTYRDHGRAERTGCRGGGSVQMSVVEDAVLAWLKVRKARDVEAVAATASRASATRVSAEADTRRAVQAVAKVDEQLKRLTLQLTEGLVPDGVYAGVRDELLAQRAGYVAQLEESARVGRRAAIDTVEVAEGLIEGWRHLPVSVRRTMLQSLIERVEVTTGGRAKGAGTGKGGVSRAKVEIFER